MIPKPSQILQRILDGSLLPPNVIATLDHDAILDARDGDAEFVAKWTRHFNEIEARWPTANVSKEGESLLTDIRRESFLTVSRATGQHEVASYVSDDFDIIVRGSLLGLDDNFLNSLWDAYSQNEIPTPKSNK